MSGFGEDVAVRGDRWLVVATGAGRVELIGEASLERPSPVRGWFDGELALAGFAGDGVYEVSTGALVRETPDARLFAGADGAWVSASPDKVRADDGREWSLSDVRSLAVGEGRILALACGEGCVAYELGDAITPLGAAGEGGQVALWDGVAWWSDPESARTEGAGRVWSERGELVEGLAGDHLGRAIGGGYAAGALNPSQVPVRARVVPLAGGEVLALDRAVETRPLALAGDEGALLVGVPGAPDPAGVIGLLHVIDREDLP